ncbi:hypothetical protein ACWDRB_48805 [Nonomuraea sp. NPDC003707]
MVVWPGARSTGVERTLTLPAGPLAAGATLVVPVGEALQLGDNGGAITRLDDAGRATDPCGDAKPIPGRFSIDCRVESLSVTR